MALLWYDVAPRPTVRGHDAFWSLFARDGDRAWCVTSVPAADYTEIRPEEFAVVAATSPIMQVADVVESRAPGIEPALESLLYPDRPSDPMLGAFQALPVTIGTDVYLGLVRPAGAHRLFTTCARDRWVSGLLPAGVGGVRLSVTDA